ncbi:unnamed protein product [Protopolystoma xenopodis]|uniref:Uncharacterized protein n=1 Tax=Protopolystoma xenopodis TaxID=117903 RepID=A0A3S5C2D3_9PLAT|nr:unnamed protein product [Protopolystoma xenopodis]
MRDLIFWVSGSVKRRDTYYTDPSSGGENVLCWQDSTPE